MSFEVYDGNSGIPMGKAEIGGGGGGGELPEGINLSDGTDIYRCRKVVKVTQQYTTVGGLTDNNGILSGFSSGKYARVNSTPFDNINTANSWEIKFRFLPTGGTSRVESLFNLYTTLADDLPKITCQFEDTTNLKIWLRNDKGSTILSSKVLASISYSSHNSMDIKLNYNSSTGYTGSYALDNGEWATTALTDNTTKIGAIYTGCLGIYAKLNQYPAQHFRLDTTQSYVIINDNTPVYFCTLGDAALSDMADIKGRKVWYGTTEEYSELTDYSSYVVYFVK